jgi:hypothetical protein
MHILYSLSPIQLLHVYLLHQILKNLHRQQLASNHQVKNFVLMRLKYRQN